METKTMTIPFARTRALVKARALLERLSDPEQTPVVTDQLRAEAAAVLRHYPSLAHIELAHKAHPEVFGPVPPFSRLSGTATVQGVIDGTRVDS